MTIRKYFLDKTGQFSYALTSAVKAYTRCGRKTLLIIAAGTQKSVFFKHVAPSNFIMLQMSPDLGNT